MIKVPVTKEGLRVMHTLSKEGIPTLGTAVFHPRQILLAALAGAVYVAPYVSHIDVWKALNIMQDILTNASFG